MSQARGIVVECDWNSKSSRNVQSWKLSFSNKKQMRLSRKLFSFLKIAKGSKFARECDWIGKILKTFGIWFFFQNIDGTFEKFFWRFEKLLEPAKLPKNATGRARILKTFWVKTLGFW